MPRYIRHNSLKQRLVEDLRIARSWKVLFLWLHKVQGRRLDFSSPIAVSVPFEEFQIQLAALLPDALQKLSGPLEQAAAIGFNAPLCQQVPTLSGENVTSGASLRHRDGEIVCRITHCLIGKVHPPAQSTAIALLSRLSDGRLLVTTDRRKSFDSAPTVIAQRVVNGSLDDLFAMHAKKLDALRSQSVPERIGDDFQMMRFVDRLEVESIEHNCRRGLYEEVPPEEVAAAPPPPVTPPGQEALEAANASAVLAQIEEQQNKQSRSGRRQGLLIAGLSLMAFFALGGVRWDWTMAAVLAGVVLVHELGHFVAMRMFRYRDLRMFFIPLLGAAVTGRHYNVKGWQQAIVSLAGPVPGIVIGSVFGWIAAKTGNPLLTKIALVSLVLNGINLIPVLPLDGGWVLHAVLFGRHYVWETTFRIFAALALIGATLAGRGKFWAILGFLMLLTVPLSHRLGKLARELRQKGVGSTSADSQTIPPETALSILDALKRSLPGHHTTRLLAGHVLAVFQKLNATPPGPLVAMLLLMVYLGAAGLAALGTAYVRLHRSHHYADGQIVEPTLVYPEHSLESAGMPLAPDSAAPAFVATFPDLSSAMAAFQETRAELGSQQHLLRFGQSLFLSGSNLSSEWPARLQAAHAVVLQEAHDTNLAVRIDLTCRMPSTNRNTEFSRDLETYFDNVWRKLWPPWAPWPPTLAPKAEDFARARRTWWRLHEIEGGFEQDPELKKLARQIRVAARASQFKEIMQLVQAQNRRREQLREEAIKRWLASAGPETDPRVVRLYQQTLATGVAGDAHAEAWQRLAAALGQLPLKDRRPIDADGWTAAVGGGLLPSSDGLQFVHLEFYRTAYGLPAFITYLEANGCTDFKYALHPPRQGGQDDEESDEPEQ
jgi:Zn-dependent protease